MLPMYSYNFLITIRITYEELCIKISSILTQPNKFNRQFKKKKLSEKLKISVVYIKSSKKSKYFENITAVYR